MEGIVSNLHSLLASLVLQYCSIGSLIGIFLPVLPSFSNRQAGTVTKMPQTNPARAAMRRPRALTIATATGLCCCLFLDSSSVVGVSAATASSVSREVSSR